MSDIVYYRVPLQHMNFGYEGECTHDCWTEFIVVDSESVYQKRNRYGNMSIDLFVRNEDLDKIEKIISKWADKGDYFEYELGQTD